MLVSFHFQSKEILLFTLTTNTHKDLVVKLCKFMAGNKDDVILQHVFHWQPPMVLEFLFQHFFRDKKTGMVICLCPQQSQ